MTIEELKFLRSDEGAFLTEKYQEYTDRELDRLLLKLYKDKIPHLSVVVSLLKLRRKGEDKFSQSRKMFFTPSGLEQSTSEKIAEYIAERFKGEPKIVDLTCGIGGNAIFLAKAAREVIAVDLNPMNTECAKANAETYGVQKKITFISGDAFDNIREEASAFFIDPSREREGQTKTRSILNSEPNLLKILPEIFKVTKNVCVKISPAFDYQEIEMLPEKPEIEVISEDNVCKVVLLCFGKFKTSERKATCIIKDKIYHYTDQPRQENIRTVERPLEYLYEPNKAIIKAHLIEEAAAEFGLKKINPQTAFLTGAELISRKKEIFRIFKVVHCGKFSIKAIKAKLKEENISRADILTKRFPHKPEEIYEKLKIGEGGGHFLILTALADEKYYFILASRE